MAYGVNETNPLTDNDKWQRELKQRTRTVNWAHPDLAKITRFRLLSDPGFDWWDISYCEGTMKDGELVNVFTNMGQLPKYRFKSYIVEAAKADGVYAKGLGIFDAISTLC